MENKKTLALVESAVMIALASVLSLLKLADLPAGGSVTFASMLPIVLISYRHGAKYGLAAGTVYGVIQQLLGLRTLSYVTGFASVLAVILLDYVIAFAVLGLGGVFRKSGMSQSLALVSGAALASVLRYICHVVSGATVWAGLTIPTSAVLVGSLAYNATYMIPETLILLLVLFYISEAMDFSSPTPRRVIRAQKISAASFATVLSGGVLLLAAAVYDVIAIFSALQETGELAISGFALVPWGRVALITLTGILIFVVAIWIARRMERSSARSVRKD
ncbi:MAG: energy-coupled thiamine transporter ThiT [Clostridia bacterium]|nr:energy-coupled thiamine transporter ThiT [Clostridia bacterium]